MTAAARCWCSYRHCGCDWPSRHPCIDAFDPQPGDVVCDCRYRHLRVTARDGDNLLLEDGSRCSLAHCCDPPGHLWQHPGRDDDAAG
jgi:hypothetical protein